MTSKCSDDSELHLKYKYFGNNNDFILVYSTYYPFSIWSLWDQPPPLIFPFYQMVYKALTFSEKVLSKYVVG